MRRQDIKNANEIIELISDVAEGTISSDDAFDKFFELITDTPLEWIYGKDVIDRHMSEYNIIYRGQTSDKDYAKIKGWSFK